MKFKALVGTINYTLKKYAPEILLGVGIVGVLGSTFLACKATLKAEELLDEQAEKADEIEECVALRKTGEMNYTEQDEAQDRRILMFATGGKFFRLYGPSATLMLFSIGCILGSYRIMKTRNVALMAMYKLLEEAFTNYRRRVTKELGVDADARFLYGQEEVEGSRRTITDKDGKEHEIMAVTNNLSGYARMFERDKPDQFGSWTGSTQWSSQHEYNLQFLFGKEEHFNNMLVSKGFVTVNDVNDELGFPRTEAGMIAGWRYKSERGDGYISFRPRGTDGNWALGRDGCSILIDYNIDGVIFDPNVARIEQSVSSLAVV